MNEPQNLKAHKQTQVTKEHQFIKEPQISKERQIKNEPQILKERPNFESVENYK
jgi:hypothetical protein